MDRVKNAGKNISKGAWRPSGDHQIHRDTWKSDLKGMATGRKDDHKATENALSHQSRPLGSLKDPDSFGPPPKHSGAIGSGPATPTSPARPQSSGGWGSVAPTPRAQQQEEQQRAEEEAPPAPPVPYRPDTTGLSTNNLPKPPVRRADPAAPPTPPRHSTPAGPAVPPRHQQAHQEPPAPTLPPRMNDHPDEFTPAPPPSYNEATTQATQRDPAALNAGSVNRLAQAGVSVPGFGIGHNQGANGGAISSEPSVVTGHGGQLSELQQRFARMNAGAESQASPPPTPSSSSVTAAAAAHKKPPPPPPPKKPGLSSGSRPSTEDAANAPPPLPLSSKPRPG
jgi:hypothetical protein